MAGDSPDLGAKVITITDNNKKNGDKISSQLGMELFSLRKYLAPKTFSAHTSLIKAKKVITPSTIQAMQVVIIHFIFLMVCIIY